MTKIGGTTSRFYRETRGIKVSSGQRVTSGTILTRQGDRWHPGLHVNGKTSLTAGCDGEVYFTRKKNKYRKVTTYINIRPVASKN